MKKLSLFLIIAAILYAKTPSVTQLFNVQTVKVKEINASQTLSSYGYIRIDQSHVYIVAPRFGGYVQQLYAQKIYQKVTKGELLATVYSPKVLQAKENYQNILRYAATLHNPTLVRSAKTNLRLLGVAQKRIAAITKDSPLCAYTNIYAPQSGYLFIKNISNGSAFRAGEQLFKIVGLQKVWVEVAIAQDMLGKLPAIQHFSFTTPAYDKRFSAIKKELYPTLAKNSAKFTLRLEAKNPQSTLLPGMYVNVHMQATDKTYLTLPSTAVILKNGKYYVFLKGDFAGEWDPKQVKVKRLNSQTYIIRSGVHRGEEVVNNALFLMDSNAQINGLY
jgi:membrane fusion protein, copper/silver efflux system